MLREYLKNIADVLREKLGITDKINAQDFADKVNDVYDTGYENGLNDSVLSRNDTDWSYAFYDGTRKEKILSLTSDDTKHIEKAHKMLNISTGAATPNHEQILHLTQLDFSNLKDGSYMFYGAIRDTSSSGKHYSFNFPSLEKVTNMFYDCRYLTYIDEATFGKPQGDVGNMFYGCENIRAVPLFDTSEATTAWQMFYNCKCIKTLPPFDTSKVRDFYRMLYGCTALKTIELLDFTSATKVSQLGYQWNALENINEIRGTFKGDDVNFQYAYYLTLDTLKRIFIALEDYSGTDNEFKYTITLYSSRLTLINNDGKTSPNGNSWVDYANDKGWNVA